MFLPRFFAHLAALFIFSPAVFCQYQKINDPSGSPALMPVSEVREGMKGIALTVFKGDKPEQFNVEILGLMPNWIGPRQDMIVGRLSGANAERTFVFAGMSGSPVYINGRLVGAISYSFPFAKEPICGITPIEQMISVTAIADKEEPRRAAPRPVAYAELLSNVWQPHVMNVAPAVVASGFSQGSALSDLAGQTMVPISTPMTFYGVSQTTINMLAPQLRELGILPIAAAGGSGVKPFKQPTATTLLGGDSVIVHLSRGDVEISAAGTVTLRDGDKIYAFGHPFFSLGSTNLPMSESHVVTVVPNANNSFKLAVPDSTVGSMTQDRATAIYGSLGQEPKMMPVKIRISTSRGRTEEVNFETAIDPILTPLIVSAGVGNALAANERTVGDATIEVHGRIELKGEKPIVIERRFIGPQASVFAASSAAIPLATLLRENFAGMAITGVDLDMTAVDTSSTAVLDRISVDRTRVQPGDSINVAAYERTSAGEVIVQNARVTVPADTPAGRLSLLVGDGASVQRTSPATQFVPASAADFISTFNSLKRPDRLYAVLTRTTAGVILGSSEMPDLPPSVLATMNNGRSVGGSKAVVQTVIAESLIPRSDRIVSGAQTLTLDVVR